MELIKNPNFNFVGNRRIAYAISIVIIAVGLISLLVQGLNYGVDFVGGTLLQFRFNREVEVEEVREALEGLNLAKSTVQRFSPQEVIIRSPKLSQEEQDQVEKTLGEAFGEVTLVRVEDVGPAVGADLRRMAIVAVLVALLGILLYVSIRFEFRPGVTSIIALVHDALVTLGMLSLLQREFSAPVLAAILTILGYSINDSIVVMDRVRENLRSRKKGEGFGELVNRSINETLSRTINTVLTTILPVLALLILGGEMLRDFSLTLLIGLIAGTYSSIFIVSSLWVEWEEKKPLRR
ncbi:MAG TPA: protein translocase subunit SecF [Candidatus Atribacteria bacterium]|nr:protein translocase subunit SecF [Candidatus Atribacteria bacterium]